MLNFSTSCLCCSSSSEPTKNSISENELVNNSEHFNDENIRKTSSISKQNYFCPEFLKKYCVCFYRKVGAVSESRVSSADNIEPAEEQGTPIIPIISPPEPYVLSFSYFIKT